MHNVQHRSIALLCEDSPCTPDVHDTSVGTTVLRRGSGSFGSRRSWRRYWVILITFVMAGIFAAYGLVAYENPMPRGTEQFWLIAERRLESVTAMAFVAVCQAVATVAFHTVTNNRIITPSIMGFESLYTAIHTAIVYFFGVAGLANAQSTSMFVIQILLMVGLSILLYSWLLTGTNPNMHAMLLVGVAIGGGLGSIATFMQRMLNPSEFDVLSARLYSSVNHAETAYYPIAIPIVVIAVILLFANSKNLDAISLGRDVATNLGVHHRAHSVYTLIVVSVLMAISTALVGPMTFLGFLVATLAYQFVDSYDHRFIFPMAAATAFLVLTGAYFIMNHIFYAQGVVSIIIELIGGSVFLLVIVRKGRL